ncbi:MAG: SDR family NAD(P)-dependent oxidoreductase [Cytophagales bacterium]|nr:SDR family NAD(P)-dependent oxidoreductase [Cytophagales bacterium]
MGVQGEYDGPWKAMLKGISDLYGNRSNSVNLPKRMDLKGKTVLITGSSSGLGFAAARRMAKAGAKLIMAVRSGIPEKKEELIRDTSNRNVKAYHVDLLDFVSITKLLEDLERDEIKVDVLVSNAAMVPLRSRKTKQGLEEMFMVNYLAPFHLINQFIHRRILNIERGKIIIVSSESHRNAKGFEWEEFGRYHDYGINETVSRYGYFKLLLTTFANELSRRLDRQKQPIRVRVLCPGPVNSNIAREAPGWMQPILKGIFALFFRSPEKASDPILYFATETNSSDRPVDYLFLMQRKKMDQKAVDEENGKKLWELSERLIEKLGYSSRW